MAQYRYLYCQYWNDPNVLEFTPDEKLFYIYLLTNPHTTQCGIYEVSLKQMVYETGYSLDTVQTLIERFENKYERIYYNQDTKEMAIRNWIKYNFSKSPKVVKCIQKELDLVKDKSLIQYVYPMDTLSIVYGYGIGKEKEKEKEKEKSMYVVEEQENEVEPVDSVDNVDNLDKYPYDDRVAKIAQTYEKVFCRIITPMQREKLLAFLDDGMDCEAIIKALEITSDNNKDGLKYTLGILFNWQNQGVKTLQQAEDAIKRFETAQKPQGKRDAPGVKTPTQWQSGIDFSKFREN